MLPALATGPGVMAQMPWGTHFCYFYETKQDLIEASVPFFQAGLENREFCLWIVCAPLNKSDALQALRDSIPGVDRYLAEGGIEVWIHHEPKFEGDIPELGATMRSLREKTDDALARGYAGMRVAGSPSAIQKAGCHYHREFERELGATVANGRMIALCQFPLAESSATEILEAARTHQFVVARRQGEWEIIETPEIKLSKAEIAKLNEQLEQRVEERTRELEAANQELRQEIARRERVEEDLRQQKEILQSIFDHVPLIVKFVDKAGRTQMVNGEWERVLGRTLSDILDGRVDMLKEGYPDPLERQRVLDFVTRADGKWEDFRTQVKDGRVIDTSWAVARLSDGATVCIGQDISERKRTEQELRKQKEILETIFDHIPVMIGFVGQDQKMELVNREAERTLGWSREELRNLDIDLDEVFCPDPLERQRVHDSMARADGQWEDFRTSTRDGRVIDTSWAVVRLSDGAAVCIGQDVTQRKRAEQELRAQKDILQTIFDHIPLMINFTERGGIRPRLMNRECERALGWPLEEIVRDKVDLLAELYPDPEYRAQVSSFILHSNGEWRDFKTKVRDGRVLDTAWVRFQLPDGSSLGIGQDVTERKQAERELRKQKEILQTIFDHIPVMISFSEPHSLRPRLANREWERSMGWSSEEIQRDQVDLLTEIFPDPECRERARDFLFHSTGEWKDFKTRVRDGRVTDTSWVNLRLPDGSSIGIGQDVTERKRAERELRKQKDILQTIFDHIPVMITFSDQDLEPKLANRECERTLGWSLEEIVRDKVDVLAELYPDPEYREQVLDFMLHSNGEWRDFKTRVRDGRVIDGTWVRLVLPDGSILRMGQDITARKRAEEALRESEERFRQLTENIRDLFWIKTPDLKRAIYFSPSYESISGRSREEAYQAFGYLNFLKRVVPEDRERMAQFMERPVEAEFEIEYRITHPDGSVHWVCDRGFPIRDQSGQIYRVAGIIHDISESKAAERALRESEERFRQLTENIHEVFWLRSPDLKHLLYLSPIYEKVYGQSPEAVYAKGVDLDMVHPEDRSRVMELIENFQAREFEIEYRIVIPATGEVRWLRDRGFPIRNQAGQIYRIGGVAEDITDRKKAEERLEASSEQLRALSASLQSAREEEAARIAHQIHDELGGILTGLKWELETLDKMLHQPADPGSLKAMEDKLAVMAGLTDTTINAVRRIASELRPSILDDLGLIEAVEWQTQQFQARTGIECHCDCSLQSIPLNDRQCTTLFRIVQEALTNILRHAQATRVEVAMRVVDDLLELTVSDNGRGITPAETLSKKSLGLLGMRERAHLIGGRVDIAGLRGAGTTVHVRVPLEGAVG